MYPSLHEDSGDCTNMERPMKPAPPPPYNKLIDTSHEYSSASDAGSLRPVTAVAMPAQPTVVSITNTGTETSQPVGPKPVILTCPQCRCRGKTQIKRRSTAKTHLSCLLLSWTL